MKVGERAFLICPPDYGYGARGVGGVYPFQYCLFLRAKSFFLLRGVLKRL